MQYAFNHMTKCSKVLAEFLILFFNFCLSRIWSFGVSCFHINEKTGYMLRVNLAVAQFPLQMALLIFEKKMKIKFDYAHK